MSMMAMNTDGYDWPEFLPAQANDSAANNVCLVLVTAVLTACTVFIFSVVLPLSHERIDLRVLLPPRLTSDLKPYWSYTHNTTLGSVHFLFVSLGFQFDDAVDMNLSFPIFNTLGAVLVGEEVSFPTCDP